MKKPINNPENVVAAAEADLDATIPLVARKGRANCLGERSAGHQNPSATSSYMLIKARGRRVDRLETRRRVLVQRKR
jgi:dihydroxyacetone kinase